MYFHHKIIDECRCMHYNYDKNNFELKQQFQEKAEETNILMVMQFINNTVLYCVKNYSGELKLDSESKEMKFFGLDNLPLNQNDPDLIEVYKKSLNNKSL